MSYLIVIVGLPGSGKSTAMPEFERRHDFSHEFDDFKKDPLGGVEHPMCVHSRHYGDMISALLAGNNVVINDIDFCRREAREELEMFVKGHSPKTQVEYVFFANDPDRCRQNVRASDDRVKPRLRMIDVFAEKYTIPDGATVLPVWDGSGEPASAV